VHDLVPSLDHPPGYYGAGGSPRAVNVLGPKSTIAPLPALPPGTERLSYASEGANPLKSWLLLAALALLFADILAVIFLQWGGFRLGRAMRRAPAASAAIGIGLSAMLAAAPPLRASRCRDRNRVGAEQGHRRRARDRGDGKVTLGT
jgi:hypothetical protein